MLTTPRPRRQNTALRKRPKPARRRGRAKPKSIEVSDRNRRPIPNYTPPPYAATYYVTARGRVYRDDGRMLAVRENLHVDIGNPTKTRSLPKLVAEAFGLKPPSYGGAWRAWVDPDGPIDQKTGRLRCSIADLVYVPHSEIIAYHMSGRDPDKKPKTRIDVI